MELITQNNLTMSSYDFLNDVINPARLEAGENKVRNDDFVKRVEDELDDLGGCETFASYGKDVKYYVLTLDQMMLVGMRESKAVRKNVLAKLKAMESKIPSNLPDALRLAADLAEENARIALERDHAIKTKAEIGSKREATAMSTASKATREVKKLKEQLDQSSKYATVKRMEMIHHGVKFNWRILKSTGIEMGINPIEVFDQNYGTVKAYHVDVWREAYAVGVELAEL